MVEYVKKLADTVLVRPGELARSAPLSFYPLDPRKVKEVAGVQRLAELGPRTTRSLTARTLLDDSVLLPLVRVAVQNQELIWFINPEDFPQAAALQSRFGNIVHCISCTGPAETGADARPPLYVVKPDDILKRRLSEDPSVADAFRHVDAGRVTPLVATILAQHKVRTTHNSWLRRLLHNPLFSVYVVVFVYSVLRALPVSFVKEFHGSLLIFWTIDVVTAIPYTWGVLAMLFGRTWQTRTVGGATTIVTFVSPYIYFWLNGSDYPAYVPAVIVALTVVSVSVELVKYLQERRLERAYLRSLGFD